jgi:hypothetical protein
MIKQSGCKTGPRKGNFSGITGHENCGSCPGNYYNGGECNYGGQHVLKNEIAQINRNFEGIDKLEKRHLELRLSTNVSESEFNNKKQSLLNDFNKVRNNCCNPGKLAFYATCVGVENQSSIFQRDVEQRFKNFTERIECYIKQVEKTTWRQVQEFQTKLRKIEDLRKENNNLLQEYKDPNTSPERKAQISEIIDQNEAQMANLDQELDNHSARLLFDPETENILRNAKYNLFNASSSKNSFANLGKSKGKGNWSGKNNKFKDKQKETRQQNLFSPQVKEVLKTAGLSIIVIAMFVSAYCVIRSTFNKNR